MIDHVGTEPVLLVEAGDFLHFGTVDGHALPECPDPQAAFAIPVYAADLIFRQETVIVVYDFMATGVDYVNAGIGACPDVMVFIFKKAADVGVAGIYFAEFLCFIAVKIYSAEEGTYPYIVFRVPKDGRNGIVREAFVFAAVDCDSFAPVEDVYAASVRARCTDFRYGRPGCSIYFRIAAPGSWTC